MADKEKKKKCDICKGSGMIEVPVPAKEGGGTKLKTCGGCNGSGEKS